MATRAVSPVSIDEVCSFIKYLEERSNRFGCLNEQYLELQARFSKQEKDYTTVARELEEVKEQKQHQEDVITILEGECVELREQNQQIQVNKYQQFFFFNIN